MALNFAKTTPQPKRVIASGGCSCFPAFLMSNERQLLPESATDSKNRPKPERRELRPVFISPDIGYPRSVVRTDGNVVTVYAFHDRAGSVRDIEATIWDP